MKEANVVMDRRELEAFEASVMADDEVRRMLEDITHSVAVEVQKQSPTRLDVTTGAVAGGAGWPLAVGQSRHPAPARDERYPSCYRSRLR